MRTAIISVILLSVLAATAAHCAQTPFKDVPSDHWAAEYVRIVAADGVMKGYPDATFRGDKPVTRYELAVALERMIAYIEGSLKPEVERQAAPSSQPSPPEEGASNSKPQIQNAGSQMPAGDPALALKAGGYIAEDSPLLKDPNKTVSAKELAQALSSVAIRLIEKYIPPPQD